MFVLKPFRRFWIASVGFAFLLLITGCAAPVVAPSAPSRVDAVASPTTEKMAAVPNGAPQIEVENAWSQPALLMSAMPAPTVTPCPTPDPFADPCDASGDPMPCPTPAMADMNEEPAMMDMGVRGVVYLTLTNQGSEADRLIQVESPVAASAGLHQTTMDSAGVMRMRPLDGGLQIPAGEQVLLEPASYHIMLVDLKQNLNLGDLFPVVLTFEISDPITVTSEVRLP